MGITLFDADIIVQEHCFKPLPETIHLLGRQTVHFSYEQALHLLARHGVAPASVKIEFDNLTRDARISEERFISDTTFFRLLGVKQVMAIDHSDYEGAEILVDLNCPLPARLEGTAEFIFGGSVLDNVFDPAGYIRNITRLLRPGGRIIDSNACSFSRHAYALASPAWYLDYCVTNQFADCSVYAIESGPHFCDNVTHVYGFDITPWDDLVPNLGDPPAGLLSGVVLIAEKGDGTAWDYTPSQDGYRNAEEWERYRTALARIKAGTRPFLRFSRPSPMEVTAYPIRRARGLTYLGCFNPAAAATFDPVRHSTVIDEEITQGIRIVEATYGWSQRNAVMHRTGMVPIYRGNVTGILAFLLNGRDGCDMEIDARVLGDPAPDLPKDLSVRYYDATEPQPRLQHVYVPAEAHGKRLVISTKSNCNENGARVKPRPF